MTSLTALEVAQNFVQAIETRDRDTIERSLDENARQIFPMGPDARTRAIFKGKAEVLEYTEPPRFSWRAFCLSDQAATSWLFSEA